ncbi:MAG: glutathione S-transferase [Rhizobiaceae bacterium]|nr:glutathione S-transferase [Rhizobiaceae bacterium]
MKLLSSGASPYVSKVAIAAKFAGIDVETVNVDSTNGDPVLDAANPLSKIPCLVLDDGTGVYDSRAITRHLDRLSGGKLYPGNDDEAALLKAERFEALCDGINDCAVGYMYEARFRPEEKVHQPWRDRLWGKVERGLDAAMASPPPSGADANIGSIALAAALGYLDLRFSGKWQPGRDDLVAWRDQFDAAHPELVGLKPNA